ncbi:uroporphyrinogen-III synthase [Fertoebacter nigrum]|uniref:Uroporphyrinogen-III synthase n=1 Tax=Fertoeibacter niger TaxID=2656921 RepID=A0A8X8H482_9RHOB|nr:uroporphyrinogen-III synthase [Fertoeibacter niger]NUB45308.1 uroporphyrinogen-III synthase [Fertoeibacter niger]
MARQSHVPPILLTRPAAQADRFAALLRARMGELAIVTSPLLAPEFLATPLPAAPVTGLVFTSETGVAGFLRLPAAASLAGLPVWCVGDQTARVARAAGLAARSASGDAAALLTAIVAAGGKGPLLHLCGQDTRGNLAARLTGAGISTTAVTVYAQRPQGLTPGAMALLHGPAPVVVPLFSPRTAALFAAAAGTITPLAPLWVVAFSPAVADAVPQQLSTRLRISAAPDAAAMAEAVAALIAAAPHA